MSAVQVAVRARPLSQRELDLCSPFCVEVEGQATTLYRSSSGSGRGEGLLARSAAKEFSFDYSYWSVNPTDDHFCGQEKVYSDLGVPVVEAAFAGFNSCVFAYGQTGSGKTYTMMGAEGSLGLIPRICESLYSCMETESQARSVSYRSQVSYMEIYNEKVRDLLRDSEGGPPHSLRVREHPKEGPYVEELSQHSVTDYAGIARLLQAGNTQRVTASTKMNDASSRSHAIFTLVITQALVECGLPSETRSKLHLVDLAGSERASATGAQGDRLKEGGSINRSLVSLGTVISALADKATRAGHKKPYIPYRDSVLTWLLKDSLGGNAKTIMIATISPAESSYGETLSTLRYASRAKKIINKPVVNEDSNVQLIRELRQEIHRLKEIITTSNIEMCPEKRIGSTFTLAEDIHKKEEQVAELTREWTSKWEGVHQIIQERHLALHSEGMKMVINSEKPHLVGVDPDIFSTGLVFFYLKGESTTVGSSTGSPPSDIVVSGADIHEEHCRLEVQGSRVLLHPLSGSTYINRHLVSQPTRLRQGDLLQLGGSSVFRFNHPQEAKRLRKRHSEGLLSPKRLARVRARRRTSSQGTQHSPTSPAPDHTPSRETVMMELQSQAVVRATAAARSSRVSLSGLKPTYGASTSCLVLHNEQTVVDHTHWSPFVAVRNALFRRRAEKEICQEVAEESRASPRWRRWLWCLLLLFNAPLLLLVLGTLTLPAFTMLGLLLTSTKVFGLLNRFRLFRCIAMVLALVTTAIVSPVAGMCEVVFRVGFSALASLSVLHPAPLHPAPRRCVSQPG